jgi:type VI secretion system secreted protein VgrG
MPRSNPYADLEIFDYPATYEQHGDGDQYAKSRIQALQASFEQPRVSATSITSAPAA